MTRRKKLVKKEVKKPIQSSRDILKSAMELGWIIGPFKTAHKVEAGGMIRLNCRGRISTTLEKKVVHSARDKKQLRITGASVRTSHWEVVRKCKHKDVVITKTDIKL